MSNSQTFYRAILSGLSPANAATVSGYFKQDAIDLINQNLSRIELFTHIISNGLAEPTPEEV